MFSVLITVSKEHWVVPVNLEVSLGHVHFPVILLNVIQQVLNFSSSTLLVQSPTDISFGPISLFQFDFLTTAVAQSAILAVVGTLPSGTATPHILNAHLQSHWNCHCPKLFPCPVTQSSQNAWGLFVISVYWFLHHKRESIPSSPTATRTETSQV